VVGFERDVGGKESEAVFGVVYRTKGTAAQSWNTVCDTLGPGDAAASCSPQDIVPCRVTMGRRQLALAPALGVCSGAGVAAGKGTYSLHV